MKNIIIVFIIALVSITLFFNLSGKNIEGDKQAATTTETSISTILQHPQEFHGKEVNISGEVGKAVGLIGYGLYQLHDETGSIMVAAKNGIPAKGKILSGLSGTVRQSFSFGDKTFLILEEGD